MQLHEYVAPDGIFNADYAYFSSYSDSWVEHAETYVEMIAARSGIGEQSFVVELASNDGYLLQHFVKRGVPLPRHRAGGQRRRCGARERRADAGRILRHRHRDGGAEAATGAADLILGNNVLAHVPDINDFVGGAKTLLTPRRHGHVRVPAPACA